MIDVYRRENMAHIICLDHIAPTSWEEYHAAIREAHNLAAATPGTVYLLHNLGNVPLPEGNAFPHLTDTLLDAPTNVGGNFMAIGNVFARRAMELALKIANMENSFFLIGDISEAQNLLLSARPGA